MHEIVNISIGATANHLNGHFYNSLESYFVYDEKALKHSVVTPRPFFSAGLSRYHSQIPTVTPRLLLWDLRGGIGKKDNPLFDFSTDVYGNQVDNNMVWDGKVGEMKNEEKKGLASWHNQMKIVLHPDSLNELKDWEYAEYPKTRQRGSTAEFLDYDQGVEQWDSLNVEKDYLEENLRPILEKCDLLDGINLSSEIDSGWSGFSSKMLTDLRDSIPKTTIVSWAFGKGKLDTSKAVISRSKALVEFEEMSSLLVTVCPPSQSWENLDSLTQYYMTLYETFLLLPCLRSNRVSLQNFVNSLTSASSRNIAQGSSCLVQDSEKEAFSFGMFKDDKHVFSESAILRPGPSVSSSLEEKKLPVSLEEWSNFKAPIDIWKDLFEDPAIAKGADTKHLSKKEIAQKFTAQFADNYNQLYSALTISDAPYSTLNEMSALVSKAYRGDGREELKERLVDIAAEYHYGWSDDEDEDD